ncbi:RNA helicase domain-containing protein, partial [Haloferax sp. AB510]|uniref:RNA helicase domain-containing protein n=1 Tax=Haloferax sp. AB510 TaxID=2934172 RepID=UPI00209C213C
MSVKIEQYESPHQLEEALDDGSVLLYGAPDVGKSHVIYQEWKRSKEIISSIKDIGTNQPDVVVFDDIYKTYQEYLQSNDPDVQSRFERLVNRDKGICYLSRPRAFDWAVHKQNLGELIDIDAINFLYKSYDE